MSHDTNTDTDTGTDTDTDFAAAGDELTNLASLVGGRAWGLDRQNPRIYLPASRGRKNYFFFPDYPTGDAEQPLGGAEFGVWIADCGQPGAWYASQRRLEISAHHRHGLAIQAAQASRWGIAEQIMECDEIGDADVDLASGHLLNGRVDEAVAILGL